MKAYRIRYPKGVTDLNNNARKLRSLDRHLPEIVTTENGYVITLSISHSPYTRLLFISISSEFFEKILISLTYDHIFTKYKL